MDQEAEAVATVLRRAGIQVTAERAAELAGQFARLEQVWSLSLAERTEPWTPPAGEAERKRVSGQ